MRRTVALLLILLVGVTTSGCQSMVDDRMDSYLDTLEDRAIRDAVLAAESVGAPPDLYAALWDKKADPADRLRLAGHLISDLIRNGVPVESSVHVALSVGVMLSHQYRGDPP